MMRYPVPEVLGSEDTGKFDDEFYMKIQCKQEVEKMRADSPGSVEARQVLC